MSNGKTCYGVEIRPFRHNQGLFPPTKRSGAPSALEKKQKYAPLTTDQLLALVQGRLEGEEIAPPLPTGGGLVALVKEWARYFGVHPGKHPAGRSSDLFRHFLAWCNGEAGLPPDGAAGEFGGMLTMGGKPPSEWTRTLRHLGLVWKNTRVHQAGTPAKVFYTDTLSSRYLTQWIAENAPTFGPNPWARRGQVRRQVSKMPDNLEELLQQVRETTPPEIKEPRTSLLGLDVEEDPC